MFWRMNSEDSQGRGREGDAEGFLAPVEVVSSGDDGGGAPGSRVRVSVQGGVRRLQVRGCAGMGCCMAWLILLGLAVLVAVIWLVKAIWVRV